MANGAIDGKLLGIMIDGEWVPCEVNSSLRVTNEILNASGEAHGNWTHNIEGYKSWTMNVNARTLINSSAAGFSQVFRKNLEAQQTYEVMFGTRVTDLAPEMIIRGTARIQDLDISAAVDQKSEYNISFVGNGPFTAVGVDEYWTIIDAMPAYADKPNIVDTTNWT